MSGRASSEPLTLKTRITVDDINGGYTEASPCDVPPQHEIDFNEDIELWVFTSPHAIEGESYDLTLKLTGSICEQSGTTREFFEVSAVRIKNEQK